MEIKIKAFDELTPRELYSILEARVRVFVVEQECAYQEVDNKDIHSHHVMMTNSVGELIGYTRLLPSGVAYDEPSIGRVLVDQSIRGTGLGKELMKASMKEMSDEWGVSSIRIQAQSYAKKFYEALGFIGFTDEYLEDDIPHVDMRWENKQES
ncbi:GNAT family N-acetyltransferase [Paenalkalicoccus suaedae]|uniref:GNAT family N-acetyltransferase n=1 Tax=Paenalkalicoccus suaedae TaxID=2592382 RepID=A0A859FCG0_9BACI|nr:GNAT family N-acetyltransferase [Paenalkalicoccus suaedae]QKS70528.1 GNAT family N-acetyltransferase [Paenalkalicoccus suaedae]